ncbi:Ppx/GppA phosphatase family protein [Paenibacillus terrigena]|uniref:Ppx/GppA phosphatase family protein n=1 Tax=Paenibacillus terrigena TaxID=369333 RepID=UPI00036F7FBB|nr:Ppx/GppA phosphatase family protein [Paenibacillus terrigena]
MRNSLSIGIIDIGSNSIRLVVYNRSENGAFQVIDENKYAARLSQLVDSENKIDLDQLQPLIERLNHFKRICEIHQADTIRVAATAAIRNAGNRNALITYLQQHTGLTIEVLSGEQEAYYGFISMANTMDVQDGFLIDIGGGSSEITLFRNRKIVNSVSFPFGCVNTSRTFGQSDPLSDSDMKRIQSMVKQAIQQEPWLTNAPGLPMIGLGGAARTIAKIEQLRTKYPLQRIHQYQMESEQVSDMLERLRDLPLAQRTSVPGLSKDRADIIIPGIIILQTMFQHCGCSHYMMSGSGIRDGMFYETIMPEAPIVPNVLEYSLRNLVALHLSALPRDHVEQVNRLGNQLFHSLHEDKQFKLTVQDGLYLHISSLLYRIGTIIDYYGYSQHTFYLIMNARLYGLTHRELILCAMIASYTTKSRARQVVAEYKEILDESDYPRLCKLGSLLQLAIALDKSETQSIESLNIQIRKNKLRIQALHHHGISIAFEQMEVQGVAKEFKKAWDLTPILTSEL